MSGRWMRWSGQTVAPVKPDVLVDVELRSGYTMNATSAGSLLWWHIGQAGLSAEYANCDDPHNDIVAWRLAA